jgi:hypothetical protein
MAVALARQVGGRSVWFLAGPNGFAEDTINLYWESSDCTGTPLLSAAQPSDYGAAIYAPFVPRAFVARGGATGVYQIGDLNMHAVSSGAFFTDAATCASNHGTFTSPNLCCQPVAPPFNLQGAEVTTFDVTSFGLIPPFQVVGP